MKTNFDVWRDSLTPEGIAGLLETSWDLCDFCPACDKRNICGSGSVFCRDNYLRWANAPAKEDK